MNGRRVTGQTRVEIGQASTPGLIELVRMLMLEYAAALEVRLDFQNFDQEIRDLPGEYAPPTGVLMAALDGVRGAGCAALRRIDATTCEMKRLYVRAEYRGCGLGRRLAAAIMDEARRIGYTKMRLDTLPGMIEALAMYESLRFRRIEAYRHNPVQGAVYMECELMRAAGETEE